jgi:hypothetical protein
MNVNIKYPDGTVKSVSERDAKILVSLKKAEYAQDTVTGVTKAGNVHTTNLTKRRGRPPNKAKDETAKTTDAPSEPHVVGAMTTDALAPKGQYERRDLQAKPNQ